MYIPPPGSLDAKVTVVFSESMAASSFAANVTLAPLSDPATSYDDATHALTLTPRWRLDCGTPYTVTLGTGDRDLAGNGLAAPVSWTFTVHEDCLEPVATVAWKGFGISVDGGATFTWLGAAQGLADATREALFVP